MSSKCTVDQLADAIEEALEEYSEETTEAVKQECKEAADECRRDIADRAPRRTGAYAKGWKVKKAYESRTDVRYLVCNPKHYPLAHLLEHGHAKRSGGRVEGRPHIAPAADRAEKRLLKKIKVVVRG